LGVGGEAVPGIDLFDKMHFFIHRLALFFDKLCMPLSLPLDSIYLKSRFYISFFIFDPIFS